MHRRPAVIAYDISSPLRRRRVYKRLLLAWLAPNSGVESRGTGTGDSLFRSMVRVS